MDSILTKSIVVALNSAWQAVGYRTVGEAITRMSGGREGVAPALAMDITLDEKGELVSCVPTKWADWIKLPVREGDLSIGVKDGAIRCPTVLINPTYSKMPSKAPRLSTGNILERDGYVCGYTGKKLSRREASVDHIIPRSRGGKNSWDNMITCEKKLNHTKGNSLNSEIGLVLISKPKAPMNMPCSLYLTEIKHATHRPFLLSTKESKG